MAYNPFRYTGIPLEDLFIYRSGLKKLPDRLDEQHMRIAGQAASYPDYNKFKVLGNGDVWFSPGMNFLQYRQTLFSRQPRYVNFGLFGRSTGDITDLDMIEGRKYPLSNGAFMFRRGSQVTINPNQPNQGAIFVPYNDLKSRAQGLKGFNRITNAGNTYLSDKGKSSGARTIFGDKSRNTPLIGKQQ